MQRTSFSPLLIVVALMGGVWSGCDSEPGMVRPNTAPNTRISAGPPEKGDTGFSVNLFWFGWDDDGFVDHYEIAWETPDNWHTPIFSNDSLFTVVVAESCCVDPLPEFGTGLLDSVYEQFHTFHVRAVDNRGVADPTPAVRSFNAKTVAPHTTITFGPGQLGLWGTDVLFRWSGGDDDGVVVSYKYVLSSLQDWRWDQGIEDPTVTFVDLGLTERDIVDWLDTLTYRPTATGPDLTEEVWKHTTADTVFFESLPVSIRLNRNDLYLFAVRAIDNAGAEERFLGINDNTRRFNVTGSLGGPSLALSSNIAGSWRSGTTNPLREVFSGQGLRFSWLGFPGDSQTELAGFSYAVDDTTEWSPFSLSTKEWPPQPRGEDEEENLWFPDPGDHAFFLRGIDLGGFIRVLPAKFRVFSGPRFCDPSQRFVLVILDTSIASMTSGQSIWTHSYRDIERALVDEWFQGYNFQVHETEGSKEPFISLMNCATSTFWFHSVDLPGDDSSILDRYHRVGPNPLPSYVSSGGNLFLCGLNPSHALAYFDQRENAISLRQNHPLLFFNTLDSDEFQPHWAATLLGISRIDETIENTNDQTLGPVRLRVARSQVADYPDLKFDPLSWPLGTQRRGFGFYDRGVIPMTGDARFPDAEVVYTANDEDIPIAIRRLTRPGINGNVVYLGLHPYFVDRHAFGDLIAQVLDDFGERPR